MTIDKRNDCTNEYLSGEFRQALDEKMLKPSESDIEKVKIKIESFSPEAFVDDFRFSQP